MIRQQAFIGDTKMLKGGLHCHTTRSDGSVAPDEVIRLHSRNGYDFLAITDHRRYNYVNYAPETDVLIIPGMELDTASFPGGNGLRCFHTVCIGPAKEDGNGYEHDETVPSSSATSAETFQPELDAIHQKKNLTIYCHPEWSATPARCFEKLQGNFAMEIWNTGCAIDNDMDRDAAYWDELLGQGIRICGVATDDGHASYQHCRGWVMVRAQKDISSILAALEAGAFYSSCGPEIYDFYVDEDRVVIDCSPVVKIRLHSDRHPTRLVWAEQEPLTHVEIPLACWVGPYDYVRMTVIDAQGNYAWTNPIYLK